MGLRTLVDRAHDIVERKKRVKISRLAYMLNKSYTYTKYSIVHVLVDLNDCIEYDKAYDELVWVCGDGGESEARELARAEAREILERMEQARPVRG